MMGHEERRNGRIQTAQCGLQVGLAGDKVVDSGDREGALFGRDHPMRIIQKVNPVLLEDRLDLLWLALQVFMVS